MNQKQLILTPTKQMDRTQWLDFRSPVFHVGKFLNEQVGFNPMALPTELKAPELYEQLYTFFKEGAAWEQYIFPTIGASEIAIIHGLNEYKSIIELYYEKVGVKPVPDFDNAAMFWGRELEKEIADKWQFWDGNFETLLDNYKVQKRIRRCRKVNAYIQNKSFPYIFVSLDRLINKIEPVGEGCLECKTISGWAADKWEAGIPPMYFVQLQTQLLATGLDFGEIAILKDGRSFDVLPFERNQSICDNIQKRAEQFFLMIKSSIAHFFLAQASPDEATRQTNLAIIDSNAPEPDDSIAYSNYLKQKHPNDNGVELIGGAIELSLAEKYVALKSDIEVIEKQQTEYSNKLKAYLGDAGSIIFTGNKSSVTWKTNVKGFRVFKVTVRN